MIQQQKSVFALILLVGLDCMSFGLLIPVLFPLLLDPNHGLLPSSTPLSTRHLLMAISLSAFPLCALISTPLVGALADKFGRKKILLLCLIGSLAGYCLSAIAIAFKSFNFFIVGRIIAGASFGAQPIAQAAVADISTPATKALNMSLISFAMTLSITIGPILGGYLSDTTISPFFTVVTPFILSALLTLINVFWLAWSFKETPINNTGLPFKELIGEIKCLWNIVYVRKLLIIFFLLEVSWSFYFQCIGLILDASFHFNALTIGKFLSYSGLWMCIGLLIIFRWLYTVLPLKTLACYFLLMTLTGLFACTLARHPYQQWLTVVIISISVGIAYTTLISLLSNAVAPSLQGRALSVASSLLTAAWFATGFIGPNLATINLNLPLYIAIITSLLAVITIFSNLNNKST